MHACQLGSYKGLQPLSYFVQVWFRIFSVMHVSSVNPLSGTLAADRQVRPPAPLSQKDMTIPVVIMIGREITMSALREWAAASGGAAHRAVKVNTLGKYKTALQARARLAQAR